MVSVIVSVLIVEFLLDSSDGLFTDFQRYSPYPKLNIFIRSQRMIGGPDEDDDEQSNIPGLLRVAPDVWRIKSHVMLNTNELRLVQRGLPPATENDTPTWLTAPASYAHETNGVFGGVKPKANGFSNEKKAYMAAWYDRVTNGPRDCSQEFKDLYVRCQTYKYGANTNEVCGRNRVS